MKQENQIMYYRIAICDDDSTDVEYISGLVKEWANIQQKQISIDTFPSAEAFLFHYAEQKDYDILLLDVEMGGMDGVSMAKTIRKDNQSVQIVFITGYSDYIAEGYEVAALHYLVKPVHTEKLFEVLDRAAEKLRKNEGFLLLKLPDETVKIPFLEICYLDVLRNYVTVHSKQDYTIKHTLSELETHLDERFYRIGRSCIVNLYFIRKVTKTEVYLSDGSILPLPRGQYESLNRAIISQV